MGRSKSAWCSSLLELSDFWFVLKSSTQIADVYECVCAFQRIALETKQTGKGQTISNVIMIIKSLLKLLLLNNTDTRPACMVTRHIGFRVQPVFSPLFSSFLLHLIILPLSLLSFFSPVTWSWGSQTSSIYFLIVTFSKICMKYFLVVEKSIMLSMTSAVVSNPITVKQVFNQNPWQLIKVRSTHLLLVSVKW